MANRMPTYVSRISDDRRSVWIQGCIPMNINNIPMIFPFGDEKKTIVFPWYLLMSMKLWVSSPTTLVLKSDKATGHVNLLMLNYSFVWVLDFDSFSPALTFSNCWYTLKRLSCHASAGPCSSQFLLVFAWGNAKTWHAIQSPKIWKAPNKRQHSPLIFIASCLSHHFQPPRVYSQTTMLLKSETSYSYYRR